MHRVLMGVLMVLMFGGSAQAGWRDIVSPSQNWRRIKDCCGKKVEQAKADQQKTFGLKLPDGVDGEKPLVVLVHGVDSGQTIWKDMTKLLTESGRQVAYFNYPSDGSIAESGDFLGRELAALKDKHPELKVDLVGHSMGAMVCRWHIEGAGFGGNVDHFIAIGPPNHGSKFAGWRWPLELHEHFWLWRTNKDWSPIWMFTDGYGEAGKDLKPTSAFLKELNGRERREGVRYTVIIGNQHIATRWGAQAVLCAEELVPGKNTRGLKQAKMALRFCGAVIGKQTGGGDGVVSVKSAQLPGVNDVVVLAGDHDALVESHGGKLPVAWKAIDGRLE